MKGLTSADSQSPPGRGDSHDGGIRIIVLSSDRRGARIGIEAPTSVNIQREELLSRAAVEEKVDD
jgi:carbon storage regulator